MITYEKISKNPQLANSLIGMSLTEFEELYARFEAAHNSRVSALEYTQRGKTMRRRRAVGAGPRHKYVLRDRVLMTLFWLRAYTTYAVLGALYSLDKTTAEANVKSVMQTLTLMACFRFERPQPDVPKLRSMQEVIDAFPDMLRIIEPEERSAKSKQQNP